MREGMKWSGMVTSPPMSHIIRILWSSVVVQFVTLTLIMFFTSFPFTLILFFLLFLRNATTQIPTETWDGPASYVKPLMGTENGGNMFPGVTLPYGIVKLGINLLPPSGSGDPYSGYHPNGTVTGFSMMHESGTGGAPKYGVVSQLPVVGTIENPLLDYSVARAEDDEAEVGWYKASLSNNVTVELAASRHAGMIRHTFADTVDGGERSILVDVSHVLPCSRGQGLEQHYVEGGISVKQDGKYQGYGVYNGGWNRAKNWTIYFCGEFDTQPEKVRTFPGNSQASGGKRVGAVFVFPNSQDFGAQKRNVLVVESKIGISFISEEKACQFITEEIPAEDSFAQLVTVAKKSWDGEVLGTITTNETDKEKLQLLYSSLYGMFIIPSDRTGENPLWNSSEPYYDDIFTLWDTYRCHTPLMHILQPWRYEDFIRSLIDTWRHDGYLPDGRSSNFNGRIQGGSSADNVLADAYVKGVRGAIVWEDGYEAMLKDAEVTPVNNNDPMAPDSSTKEGRGALPDWLKFGYITTEFSRSVSRASDYSLNDFALSQVARGLGRLDDAEKYLKRSKNWRNHWDPASTAFDFTGFLSPILPDGSFPSPPQDPVSCGGCYWGDNYYEALPFEYSFGAHHDMDTLISYIGGRDQFIARLEKLFEPGANPSGDTRFNKTLFNPGNEPSFASPYLFNFADRQDLTVYHSRKIAKSYYNTGKAGLPGNSDAGAMQSWLLWSVIGLYPLTGTTKFLISAPWLLADLTLHIGGGRTVEITTTGGSDEAIYVQRLKVNGIGWGKNWISWDELFRDGGKMEFFMGEEVKKWSNVSVRTSAGSDGSVASGKTSSGSVDSGKKYGDWGLSWLVIAGMVGVF
ncbi:hypothetical protein RUND412_005265 [Rhizina undulata]